jgi:MFS family permease
MLRCAQHDVFAFSMMRITEDDIDSSIRTSSSHFWRNFMSSLSAADFIIYSGGLGLLLAFSYIVWSYIKGLRDSPREMWLLFLTKVIEYTAYAAMNMTFILWLSADCGLGDIQAGAFISAWSLGLSVVGMITGALVDAIGIKKTLLISTVMLVFSRFFMFWLTDPTLVMLLGFIPLAIGFAIVAPVISVGIKKYTTKEGAALGFGLFYVLMNVGYAIGGYMFDFYRSEFSLKDATGKVINENAGTVLPILGHLSTYQLILLTGLFFTLASFICILLLREGVVMSEDGKVSVVPPPKMEGSVTAKLIQSTKQATIDTINTIKSVVKDRIFWSFILVISLTVFVRFVFFHFHYTFPKYGLRVLGEGAKIGSIYGVLNPVLIVFLVPFVAHFTKKVSSYKLLIIGSLISSLSMFIAVIPGEFFVSLTQTSLGEVVFVRWLGMADSLHALALNPPAAAYWPLIVCIAVFTLGEAIWSPRLMQFTVEIAPKGKEGTYLALSVLPYFAAKFVAGPMSGILVKVYTPVTEVINSAGVKTTVVGDISQHYMVWVWIGAMALLSPLGLLIFRKQVMRYNNH